METMFYVVEVVNKSYDVKYRYLWTKRMSFKFPNRTFFNT